MEGFRHGAKTVGTCHRQKEMGQGCLGGSREGKAGRLTKQLAKGVAFQRGAERVKRSNDLSVHACLNASCMLRRISAWASIKVKECYQKGRLTIAQDILRKSTDFLTRISAPVGGVGRCFLVVRVPSLSLLLVIQDSAVPQGMCNSS